MCASRLCLRLESSHVGGQGEEPLADVEHVALVVDQRGQHHAVLAHRGSRDVSEEPAQLIALAGVAEVEQSTADPVVELGVLDVLMLLSELGQVVGAGGDQFAPLVVVDALRSPLMVLMGRSGGTPGSCQSRYSAGHGMLTHAE